MLHAEQSYKIILQKHIHPLSSWYGIAELAGFAALRSHILETLKVS
jgi:hypothetical protein